MTAKTFICPASSPGWGRSCQTWVSWLGLRSCRASSAYRYEVKYQEEWLAEDPQEPPKKWEEVYIDVYLNISISLWVDK